MKKIVLKHTQFPLPPTIKLVNNIIYNIDFISGYKYDFTNREMDHLDWNKLIGIKKEFFSPMKNSIMVGWRWNPKLERLEFTDYVHEHKHRKFTEKPIFTTKGTKIRVEIYNINDIYRITISDREYFSKTIQIKHSNMNQTNWLIQHWFGGTKNATENVVINYKKL